MVRVAGRTARRIIVTTFIRIASVAGALSLALAGTASAATLRLEPLTQQTVSTTLSSCANPFVPASITQPESADIPAIAEGQKATGFATVRIELNADGQLVSNTLTGSSGNSALDQAAMIAAHFSRYSAEVRDCHAVGGVYALIVDFTQ
jgi:TonB family protein